MIEIRVKSTANVIAARNNIFSDPRRVFLTVSTESLPPNAPPNDSSDCCKRITTIRRTESTTCNIGNTEINVFIYPLWYQKVSKRKIDVCI